MKTVRDFATVKTSNVSTGGGGMPCPNCGDTIPVTLDMLLGQGRLQCPAPACSTVLRLNRHRSSDAIKAMRDLKKDLAAIEG